jgi:hypothetical protein
MRPSPGDGERQPAAQDIDLSSDERDELLDACANLFPSQRSADPILDRIGFPRGRRPRFTGNDTPNDVWNDIFVNLDNGILPGGLPYQRLLDAVIRVYPTHAKFRPLAQRHGLIPPNPPLVPPALPATDTEPTDRIRPGNQPNERPKVRGHAFISYAREDAGDVDRLQQALEAAQARVWRDTASLWPGEDWRERIRHAITQDALVFLACFSRKSVTRTTSYYNEELLLAIEQLRLRRLGEPWLIPVRFDDCDIPDFNLGGGRTLGSLQRVDLFGEQAYEGLARLTAAVLRILGQELD